MLGFREYKKWDNYSFPDYSIRQQLARTFRVRNLPLSDGNDEKNFEGQYTFDWHKHAYKPRLPGGRVKSEPAEKKVVVPVPSTIAGPSGPQMVYDVEKGCLVPFE